MATKETIADLLDRYEPSIKAAFLDAIQDIRSQAEIGRIADLLQAGDIESALQAAHLDNAAFQNLDVALANVFRAGGNFAMASLPQRGLVFRFDARNIRAEEILRAMSVGLVTRIVEDQKQALRTALVDGMERGANPRTVALDIVGRVNRQSGKREGGIVGLTAQQERFVAKARQELLSGDPAELERYLGRTRRDKRFDRVVTRAIR